MAVKPQHDLKVHIKKCEAIEEVIVMIKTIPKLAQVKNDPELLKWLMEHVENKLSSKVKDKIKLDELVFEAICEVFPAMNENEKDFIKKNVAFLVNKQIRKSSFYIRKKLMLLLSFFFKK